jgi:RNA polymerase sigma factor (sigma-70 family)
LNSSDFIYNDLIYSNDILNNCSYTYWDKEFEHSIIKKAKSGDKEALEEIINNLQLFVINIANKYKNLCGGQFEFSDLVQFGNEGLITAIKKFDLSKDMRLSTYSYFWIRQTIRRNALKGSTCFSLSNVAAENIPVIQREKYKYLMKKKRKPSLGELENETGIQKDLIEDILFSIEGSLSLEYDTGNKNDAIFGETVSDNFVLEEFESEIDDKETIKRIFETIKNLPAKYRTILEMYFGFNDYNYRFNLEEIGKELNISIETVRKHKAKAISEFITLYQNKFPDDLLLGYDPNLSPKKVRDTLMELSEYERENVQKYFNLEESCTNKEINKIRFITNYSPDSQKKKSLSLLVSEYKKKYPGDILFG